MLLTEGPLSVRDYGEHCLTAKLFTGLLFNEHASCNIELGALDCFLQLIGLSHDPEQESSPGECVRKRASEAGDFQVHYEPKWMWPGRKGFPDLLLVCPPARWVLAIEVKYLHKPKPDQVCDQYSKLGELLKKSADTRGLRKHIVLIAPLFELIRAWEKDRESWIDVANETHARFLPLESVIHAVSSTDRSLKAELGVYVTTLNKTEKTYQYSSVDLREEVPANAVSADFWKALLTKPEKIHDELLEEFRRRTYRT